MLQSSQVTRVSEVFGRRYRSLPVCCKVPKLPEFQKFFWSQIPITACLLQSSQVTRVPEVSWLQIVIFTCPIQSSQVFKVSSSQNCRFIHISCHYCSSVTLVSL